MKIVLNPGEKIEVEFAESDGCITVEFTQTSISVNADMPDTAGREGVIYLEEFGTDQIDKIVKSVYTKASKPSLLTKIKADIDLPVKRNKPDKPKKPVEHTQVDSSPMTKKKKKKKKEYTVEEKVVDIITDHLGVDPDKVIPTASLIDDLGADSLDAVELTMAFEEEFNVHLPDDVVEAAITVQDCIDAVKGAPQVK